jgi:hypothetical protein
MSSSVTTLAPAGQQHDREDANMEDSAAVPNGHVAETQNSPSDREPATNTVAIEVAQVDEDAMDTTPDADSGLVLQNNSEEPLQGAVTPSSPPANGAPVEETSNGQVSPGVPSSDVVSSLIDPS